MPAMMKCPTCGFDGPHGFHDVVAGVMVFYHSDCKSYHADNKWYTNVADAWAAAKKYIRPSSPTWTAAWDALLLEGNIKKHERLLKQWRAKH